MVVKSIPVVESAVVSGQAPLVRKDQEGGPGSGRHPEGKGKLPSGDQSTAHKGYFIKHNPMRNEFYIQKDGAHISTHKSLDDAKNTIDSVLTSEVTPPGYENIVRGLKKSGKVDNPWAVAWWMKGKGIKPKTSESAPVASGQCHDELSEGCDCPDCKKIENGVPSQLLHDETPKVPVKSFRDDIVRKTKLRKVMGKKPDPNEGPVHQNETKQFANPPGPIPKPFKKNSKDEVVGDYAPGKRYKTTEAVPSSFSDDPAGMDDTSDLDLGMLDPDDNEEIPTGDDQMWTKEEVNYRYSGDKFESCGNCVHFKFPGACNIISGPIRAVDVCDKFEAEDEDKGTDFGWQQQSEDEDAHSVTDQIVPSTLTPLKDKNVVQAKLVSAPAGNGTGGFGKSYGMVGTESPASAWGMVTGDEGGPGSGRHKFAPEQPETDEDRQVSAFTRREKPAQRAARIAGKKVDPATARAVRKAFASEGGPGSGRHAGEAPPPGVKINGIQEHPTKGPHVVFTDKITKSTMMLPANQATTDNMQKAAVDKRREFYGNPMKARQIMKHDLNAESQAIKALTNRLVESAFDTLKGKLARKKGVTSPGGLAAYIGRKKYGKAGMAKKAAAGRRKTTEAPGEFMPVGPGKTAGDASGKMSYEPTQRNKKFKGFRDSGKRVAPEA